MAVRKKKRATVKKKARVRARMIQFYPGNQEEKLDRLVEADAALTGEEPNISKTIRRLIHEAVDTE